MKRDGVWVLDSPANNAMAHFIHVTLYLLGPTETTSAVPVSIEAELYRANPIENFDTCSLRITTDSGATVLVLLTHACRQNIGPKIRIEGDGGQLFMDHGAAQIEYRPGGAPAETIVRPNTRPHMATSIAAQIRGDTSASLATLEMARAHTLVCNGAAEASPVRALPESLVQIHGQSPEKLRYVPGIEQLFATCFDKGQMLYESALADWTRPPGRKDLRGYAHFSGVVPA
jgi:hypothetical protein